MTTPLTAADLPADRLLIAFPRSGPSKGDAELKDSLAARGQLVPLLVAADFTLLNGHRRFRLGRELGWERFRCEIDPTVVTDAQKVAAIVHCDLQSQRHWLDTTGLLHARLLATGQTQKGLAAEMGFSPAVVSRYLDPIDYGEAVLALARDGRLTLKHFQAVKPEKDRTRRADWLVRAGREGMTAAALARAVRGGGRPKGKAETFRLNGYTLSFPAGTVRQVEAGLNALRAALRAKLRAADKHDLPAATVLADPPAPPAE